MPKNGKEPVFVVKEEQVDTLAKMILFAENPGIYLSEIFYDEDEKKMGSDRFRAYQKANDIMMNLSHPGTSGYREAARLLRGVMGAYEKRMNELTMDSHLTMAVGDYRSPEGWNQVKKFGERVGDFFQKQEQFYRQQYIAPMEEAGLTTGKDWILGRFPSLTGGDMAYLAGQDENWKNDAWIQNIYRYMQSKEDVAMDAGMQYADMAYAALAYGCYKDPRLTARKILISNVAKIVKTVTDYYDFLKQAPVDGAWADLADFYKNWDMAIENRKIPDFSDRGEELHSARENARFFKMDQAVRSHRKNMEVHPEFVDAYGGPQALEQTAKAAALMDTLKGMQDMAGNGTGKTEERMLNRYLLNVAGKGLAGKTYREAADYVPANVLADSVKALTSQENRELRSLFENVSEAAMKDYLGGGPLPVDETVLKENLAGLTNRMGVMNSRDYFEIYPAAGGAEEKGVNADRRMEMYRSRGKLAPGKKDTQEKAQKRAFGAEQFLKYMSQIDKAVYPEANGEGMPLMRDAAYEDMGIKGPEDLIYIDGKPAKQFVKGLGYKEEDLKNYPEIVRAEIAAAMTGARSHVDILVPDKDEKGMTVMKARELRTNLRDLNGKEHRLESSREKRADGLYQDKKREERLRKLSETMTAKRNKDIDDSMKKKVLTDLLLVGEGATFEALAVEGSFANARKQCMEQAEEIYAEALAGKPERLKETMENYARTVTDSLNAGEFADISSNAYSYMKKTLKEADILGAAFGQEALQDSSYRILKKSADEGISAVTMQGALYAKVSAVNAIDSVVKDNRVGIGRKAGVSTLDRTGSFLSNVTAWMKRKEPEKELTELWKDKDKVCEAANEYLDFLKENPSLQEGLPKEKQTEYLNKHVDYYKNYRKEILSERFFNIADPNQRYEHAMESQMRRDMAIDCNQTEEGGLKNSKEYQQLYGGEDVLQKDALAVENVQSVHKLVDLLDDVDKDPMSRVTAKYLAEKYGSSIKGMDGRDLSLFFPQNELSREFNSIFFHLTMNDDPKLAKCCSEYLKGGAAPFGKEEIESVIAADFAATKVPYCSLEQRKEKYMAAKRLQNQRKMSFEEVSREFAIEKGGKKKDSVPVKKRSNSMKSPARSELKMDEPGKKK